MSAWGATGGELSDNVHDDHLELESHAFRYGVVELWKQVQGLGTALGMYCSTQPTTTSVSLLFFCC